MKKIAFAIAAAAALSLGSARAEESADKAGEATSMMKKDMKSVEADRTTQVAKSEDEGSGSREPSVRAETEEETNAFLQMVWNGN